MAEPLTILSALFCIGKGVSYEAIEGFHVASPCGASDLWARGRRRFL